MIIALLAAASLSTAVHVVDGDTLTVGPDHVRLWGVDAPESGHPWSGAAKSRLRSLVAAGVSCRQVDTDRYGRLVSVCVTRKGEDVAATLVREGLARDWPRYSGGAYAGDEQQARAASRGQWRVR